MIFRDLLRVASMQKQARCAFVGVRRQVWLCKIAHDELNFYIFGAQQIAQVSVGRDRSGHLLVKSDTHTLFVYAHVFSRRSEQIFAPLDVV